MPEASVHIKTFDEFLKVIENYTIIVDQANELDPSIESEITKRLQDAIFNCYIPELKKHLNSVRRPGLYEIEKAITFLDTKRTNVQHSTDYRSPKSSDSPLTLLLSLAIEKKKISDSRETQSGKHNWGRLGAFPSYLESLSFKRSTSKKDTEYWPGLPTCVMALIPIWAHQTEYKISVSASADLFEFSAGLKEYAYLRRMNRMKHLRRPFDKNTQNRIDSMTNFSKKFRENPYSEELWGDSEMLQKNANAKKSDSENPLYSLKAHNLKQHKDWPAYLPVVVSTWKPDGRYLRACPLDRVRFTFLRPPAAEIAENNPQKLSKAQRENKSVDRQLIANIPSERSCAEWEGFITWISQQDHSTATWY